MIVHLKINSLINTTTRKSVNHITLLMSFVARVRLSLLNLVRSNFKQKMEGKAY